MPAGHGSEIVALGDGKFENANGRELASRPRRHAILARVG